MEQRRSLLPIVDWLKSYRMEWLRGDLVAGLTTSAVVIPKSMAYAAIAGLPLVVGLYTSLVMLVVYALLGTSTLLSVTTTTTIAILTAGTLSSIASGADPAMLLTVAATLSLLVGVFLIGGGLLRLGAVANLISDPVLTGFKAGIGIIILLDQFPKLLGLHITKGGFFHDIAAILQHLPDTSLPVLALSAAMLIIMIGLEHFAPRLPAPLITVAIGIAASAFVGLEQKGIALVGTVQSGLPQFVIPDLSLLEQLWPAALGIALMSFVETAAAGRAFMHKGTETPAADRELIAIGAGNLIGSIFQVMPGGGGTSQTAVNMASGGRSQVSGLVTAAAILSTLLFLAPLFGLMPHATLAVVVVVTSVGLIKPAEFRSILHIRSMEFRWAVIAMIGVLLLGTLKGILVAVLVSMVALMVRGSRHRFLVLGKKPGSNVFRPRSAEHPDDETFPGMLLLQPEGAIYFANVQRLGQQLRSLVNEFNPRVLVLYMRAVPELEYTALRVLTDGEEKLRELGVELWLVGLNPDVLQVVMHSPLGERLGRSRMYFTLEQAVLHYQQENGLQGG